MIDAILSFFLRLWDRITFRKVEDYSEDIRTATATTRIDDRDPAVRRFLKRHKLPTPVQERDCPVCREPMKVPVGTVMYSHKECRPRFRQQARARDLLKYRFADNRVVS